MTENQIEVLNELRKLEMNFLAASTRQAWKNGESCYMDSRVSVSRELRKKFNQGNREATAK